ncbi:M20/M25/M40 family metallo-hydrolase (plasmid) [Aminobacter sp. NyZ550]|uniref:M20 family metallopeptidase n=1 Tax=Aminobacter sp. NyZ550 TaxID=2979870 RepID=UPI0021D5EC30|nr:M20/M25/M40 family metallo-hydrolase [Aminobacter sp. NyZ550]WAX98374.1 M20/M25/M40 family metallo-hydrolase [Aminobacter sp. NyZ550]
MTVESDLFGRLRAALDGDAAIDLFRGAIHRDSITGNEANVVAYLADAMRKLGLSDVTTADFLPGRPNVWGERKGAGGGKRLLFIGHTDVVHVDGWRENWAGTEREDPFGAAIVDGAIWGRGAGDLKAGITSSLAAMALLDAAGIQLAGDVSFAFIGDEESGQPGTGVSAGIKDYVARMEAGEVERPDFVIYVEPTQLAVYPAQIGFFITDITITGRSAYFGVPELGKDALRASHAAMSALWKHSEVISARAEHALVGRSFLLITGLSGGGYIAVPEKCELSLIRKLLPGESLDQAAAEIEAAVRGAIDDPDIAVDFSYPAGRDHALGGTAAEIDAGSPEVAMLSQAIGSALSGRGTIQGAPFWSESPFFVNRLGIPAVYCAPGDIRNCHTYNEHVEIEEFLAGVIGFAAFMARFCGTVD